MKKHSHHLSHQTSRDYYINELKNKPINFNSSKNNTIDSYIDQILSISYKHISPFFEDEHFKNSYVVETNSGKMDQEFDNYLPTWFKFIL